MISTQLTVIAMLPNRNFGDQHGSWDGWNLTDDGFLIDPAGNKYSPKDLDTVFFSRQNYRETVGTPIKIYYLKEQLERKIAAVPKTIIKITYETSDGIEKEKRVELS